MKRYGVYVNGVLEYESDLAQQALRAGSYYADTLAFRDVRIERNGIVYKNYAPQPASPAVAAHRH